MINVIPVLLVFPVRLVIVPRSHNHTHFAGRYPCSAEYLHQAGLSIWSRLWGIGFILWWYICNYMIFLSLQVELTLQGKMCNGMIESIPKAFWAHTSATKRSFSLLLVLTAVSAGQGSGKRQNLWLHTHTSLNFMDHVCIVLAFLLSAEETLLNQRCMLCHCKACLVHMVTIDHSVFLSLVALLGNII